METSERILRYALATIILVVFIQVVLWLLERTTLKLTHLGSGTMQSDGTEQVLFEFTRAEPFQINGWVNLKNMDEADTVIIRQYHKLAVDEEYALYAEETYVGKQSKPLIYLTPKVSMKGVKFTLTQTTGTYKYYPWEFYMAVA
jgi:hypothetical protein